MQQKKLVSVLLNQFVSSSRGKWSNFETVFVTGQPSFAAYKSMFTQTSIYTELWEQPTIDMHNLDAAQLKQVGSPPGANRFASQGFRGVDY